MKRQKQTDRQYSSHTLRAIFPSGCPSPGAGDPQRALLQRQPANGVCVFFLGGEA